jgi:hypothetical protein
VVCLFLLEQARLARLDLSPSILGRGHAPFKVVRLRHEEGVVAGHGLKVQPGLLGLAGPRSFRPSLADMSWATWPSN